MLVHRVSLRSVGSRVPGRRLPRGTSFTDQQTVGGVDGEAAGEGVVYGEPVHVGGLPVVSPLVHIPAHVEVEGVVASLRLLAHVLQLHVGQMHRREVSEDLPVREKRRREASVEDKSLCDKMRMFLESSATSARMSTPSTTSPTWLN
ncbi:hypothetical protein EYF80_039820 [Liparis tanakae]|uniref:Uncharacterized protein n=1 Tax=Liparis tanakae TaxID=230148 RepID=A0A4Z2GBK9_9TELE|nr:hypothetical protein EYF80_039820 [Liparis tanakae]